MTTHRGGGVNTAWDIVPNIHGGKRRTILPIWQETNSHPLSPPWLLGATSQGGEPPPARWGPIATPSPPLGYWEPWWSHSLFRIL